MASRTAVELIPFDWAMALGSAKSGIPSGVTVNALMVLLGL
ncbi:hypothetical protein PP568_17295 [Mycobacteroides abscessus]|nr:MULTISPECIES: hypothetical protein [Mycobacteriaceae]MDM2406968.1 hypothetical protein [Mycobacteroides abscessus]MDM2416395.1 hypothetical protein [Mycobacteroides abscessus]MDO3008799.1 hypothetical protein [Mycobacteroides abscessus subsp. abscessus]MDO3044818.1 hypothetical protein [Mycobacteroides abscessus subsp. abscessus]MDO3150335.1 hypothetical protein [Mycobacteroides abscessus subsp. abscessus]